MVAFCIQTFMYIVKDSCNSKPKESLSAADGWLRLPVTPQFPQLNSYEQRVTPTDSSSLDADVYLNQSPSGMGRVLSGE